MLCCIAVSEYYLPHLLEARRGSPSPRPVGRRRPRKHSLSPPHTGALTHTAGSAGAGAGAGAVTFVLTSDAEFVTGLTRMTALLLRLFLVRDLRATVVYVEPTSVRDCKRTGSNARNRKCFGLGTRLFVDRLSSDEAGETAGFQSGLLAAADLVAACCEAGHPTHAYATLCPHIACGAAGQAVSGSAVGGAPRAEGCGFYVGRFGTHPIDRGQWFNNVNISHNHSSTGVPASASAAVPVPVPVALSVLRGRIASLLDVILAAVPAPAFTPGTALRGRGGGWAAATAGVPPAHAHWRVEDIDRIPFGHYLFDYDAVRGRGGSISPVNRRQSQQASHASIGSYRDYKSKSKSNSSSSSRVPTTVLIFLRDRDRKLVSAQSLLLRLGAALQAGGGSSEGEGAGAGAEARISIEVLRYSDALPADQVARAFQGADVLLTAHGFQCVGLLFMKPGSLLIELFPFNYFKIDYKYLASEVGIQHHWLQARTPHSRALSLRLLSLLPQWLCMRSVLCRRVARADNVRVSAGHIDTIVAWVLQRGSGEVRHRGR
jgi:hypothetical protein